MTIRKNNFDGQSNLTTKFCHKKWSIGINLYDQRISLWSNINLVSIDAIRAPPYKGQARLRGAGVRATRLRRDAARPRFETPTTATPHVREPITPLSNMLVLPTLRNMLSYRSGIATVAATPSNLTDANRFVIRG